MCKGKASGLKSEKVQVPTTCNLIKPNSSFFFLDSCMYKSLHCVNSLQCNNNKYIRTRTRTQTKCHNLCLYTANKLAINLYVEAAVCILCFIDFDTPLVVGPLIIEILSRLSIHA